MADPIQNGSRRTWLHRFLRREPGTLPAWILSSSGCRNDDAVSWTSTGIVTLLAGVATWIALDFGHINKNTSGWAIVGFIVAWAIVTFLVQYFVIEPCRTVERKARAIARQNTANGEPVAPPD